MPECAHPARKKLKKMNDALLNCMQEGVIYDQRLLRWQSHFKTFHRVRLAIGEHRMSERFGEEARSECPAREFQAGRAVILIASREPAAIHSVIARGSPIGEDCDIQVARPPKGRRISRGATFL